MEETIFQKIIKKEVPADIVYETDATLAFLDINPARKGHTLVIPKTPASDIFALSDEDAAHLMQAIVIVSNAVKKATNAAGINIASNNGAAAGQEVFHLHFHIIPRFSKDEFGPLPHTRYDGDAERTEYAKNIAEAISA